MKLDGKTAIGRRDENSLAGHAPRFPEELGLLLSTADMLENRARMYEVKRIARERQFPPIRPHESDARKQRLEKPGIVDTDGCNPVFARVPGFEIIRVIETSIARNANVENGIKGSDLHRAYEAFEHLPALVPGNLA